MLAAIYGRLAVVKYLLKQGASVNAVAFHPALVVCVRFVLKLLTDIRVVAAVSVARSDARCTGTSRRREECTGGGDLLVVVLTQAWTDETRYNCPRRVAFLHTLLKCSLRSERFAGTHGCLMPPGTAPDDCRILDGGTR